MDYAKESLRLHYEWKGKLEMTPRAAVDSKESLALAYTPGVAQPCLEIQKDVNKSYELTRRWNTVAVVTDGSAVLGLGDIGPEAGMPVMEGKCVLFKAFGDVDAIPLCVKSHDVDEIVNTVYLLSGSFGGVNLEDIAAPRCFEMTAGAKHVTLCDRKGALYAGRTEGMNWIKEEIAQMTNLEKKAGSLADVLAGADVFIGVSAPNAVTTDMVKTMAKDAVIFACANPTPEIFPGDAKAGGAAVVSTGRSDYPNQINNVLVFPGVFRGALDARASDINDEMKLAAARAIAELISDEELSADYIIPAAFDPRVKTAVAEAVCRAAHESGVARI